MSEISEKILNLIQNKNVSYGDLSKHTGIPKSALQRYATGATEKIPFDRMELIAKALSADPAYLMGWEERNHNFTPPLPPNAISVGTLGVLPIIGNVSAGNGTLAYDDVLGYETVDERYANDNYFYLHVVGDSMSPKIENNDLVLVHKQESVDSGNYAVVVVDEESGCVKQVKYGTNWIELRSINPYYPVRRFDGSDVLRLRVLGRVIEVKRKL